MNRRSERTADEHASWSELVSEVERWAAEVAATGSAEPYRAEQPPRGDTFTVRTATENGMHHIVAINTASEHTDATLPECPLSDTDKADLRSMVRALLDLAGHETGRASTDVVLTTTGPRIVACELGNA